MPARCRNTARCCPLIVICPASWRISHPPALSGENCGRPSMVRHARERYAARRHGCHHIAWAQQRAGWWTALKERNSDGLLLYRSVFQVAELTNASSCSDIAARKRQEDSTRNLFVRVRPLRIDSNRPGGHFICEFLSSAGSQSCASRCLV
ncbi:hypothetical protein BKA63DRAFT_515758 [Paraphoma chrysanthemicola]|nr:hypothetical protein BKA63DRAFT_515758 [Paraphoma chrysanthemicola]